MTKSAAERIHNRDDRVYLNGFATELGRSVTSPLHSFHAWFDQNGRSTDWVKLFDRPIPADYDVQNHIPLNSSRLCFLREDGNSLINEICLLGICGNAYALVRRPRLSCLAWLRFRRSSRLGLLGRLVASSQLSNVMESTVHVYEARPDGCRSGILPETNVVERLGRWRRTKSESSSVVAGPLQESPRRTASMRVFFALSRSASTSGAPSSISLRARYEAAAASVGA